MPVGLGINIGVGLGYDDVIAAASHQPALLMEDGSFLLLEDGSHILLE